MLSDLYTPLTLSSGTQLPNRLAKTVLEETLATARQLPRRHMETFCEQWGRGGAVFLTTGSGRGDAEAVAHPGRAMLDDQAPLRPFIQWVAPKRGGVQVRLQANHSRRLVFADMPGIAWVPSALPVNAGRLNLFAELVAMSPAHIEEMVARFITTACCSEQVDFDGVQVQAAHRHLLSQFLSPRMNRPVNRRSGSVKNRSRMLVDVVRGIRAEVSLTFSAFAQVNASGFQCGGFDEFDARIVIELMATLGMDLVDIIGGTHESGAMLGCPGSERDRRPGTYFLPLAEALVEKSHVPLMLTGSICTRFAAEMVNAAGVSVVGVGSALATASGMPNQWRHHVNVKVPLRRPPYQDSLTTSVVTVARVRCQLLRLSRSRQSRLNPPFIYYAAKDPRRCLKQLSRCRAWLAEHPDACPVRLRRGGKRKHHSEGWRNVEHYSSIDCRKSPHRKN